ncbi:Gfo/Idh/MocA family oxidoreductase [candidate division KSB1 bacterium]|nr:Gfo/Idh/MocA family oxidoreductase [candidate division KSB1 bacterium]
MAESKMNRRDFLGTASTVAAGLTIVPRHVLGGPGTVSPSDQIKIGYIGTGTQGIRTLMRFLERPEIRITAVCDCNRDSQDYIEWGKHEMRNRIRRFLDKPAWGTENTGCRAGLEVGREIVDTYYSKKSASGKVSPCSAYEDYREMLEKEDLDGICIMTPEHTHATIAMAAMKSGRHVIMHKPLSNVLSEANLIAETAQKTGLATHMFCAADQQTTPMIKEWIDNDAIGDVNEILVWSNRPVWPQDLLTPDEKPHIPDGFNWDLWLGPAEDRPYHPSYTHTLFRSWYDFGTGTLGDMGHYCFYQVWNILNPGIPITVEGSRSKIYGVVDGVSKRIPNNVSYPSASTVRWEFAEHDGKAPLSIHWLDGGIRPPKPEEMVMDGRDMPREGIIYIGDKGKIFADFTGGSPRLIPEKAMQAFKRPPKTLPRPKDEIAQWIEAVRGNAPSGASFQNVQPFSETLLLGTIAQRVTEKLSWDSSAFRFTNNEEANTLLYRKYRQGWDLFS